MKKWQIHQPSEEAAKQIRSSSDLSMLCAQVLAARGMHNVQEAAAFLQCDGLADPFLTADMEAAAACINTALDDGSRICIYGDYDCDGVTATVILYSYLLEMGADVTYRIPERDEGYGLNVDAVHAMHEDGVELIVTVDNGITAIAEAELIADLGMTLVITDHHQPLETLPKAAAIVDAHRADDTSPFHDLCGAGVALKLVAALDGGDTAMALEQFGELAAIATIADVVNLSGENRYLVQLGLRLLANTERVGLLALLEKSGLLGKSLPPPLLRLALHRVSMLPDGSAHPKRLWNCFSVKTQMKRQNWQRNWNAAIRHARQRKYAFWKKLQSRRQRIPGF